MNRKQLLKATSRAACTALVLAAAWLLPPALHKAMHLCPVRPDGVAQAQALPAFSRKYGISCAQCHYAYPVLNAYGRQFKMNGYVREKGAAEGVLKSPDNQLWIEKVFPWAVIIRSRPFDDGKGQVSNQGGQMGGTQSPNPNGFKSQPVNDVDFFVAGGDAARNISYFGEMDANAAGGWTPGMGDLRLGYHPYTWLNVILARRGFFPDDPYQTISSAESPTIAGRATDFVIGDQGSISNYAVTATQQMAAVNGQVNLPLGQSFLYYAAGATKDETVDTNGNQGTAPTNGNARLAFDTGNGLMLGTFGSYGHEGPYNGTATAGLGVGDTTARPQYALGGFDALWEIGDFAARAAFAYRHDEDPFANLVATDKAAYAELAYSYKRNGKDYPFLLPLIRENYFTTFDGQQKFNFVTFHLAHYFAPNLKAFAEYSVDTKRDNVGGTLAALGTDGTLAMRGNRATLQIEVGF